MTSEIYKNYRQIPSDGNISEFEKEFNKNRKCSYLGCSDSPILSHAISKLHQRNISDGYDTIMQQSFCQKQEKSPSIIEEKYINTQAGTFRGFCEKHEKLFHSFEQLIKDDESQFTINERLMLGLRCIAYEEYRLSLFAYYMAKSHPNKARSVMKFIQNANSLMKEYISAISDSTKVCHQYIDVSDSYLLCSNLDNFVTVSVVPFKGKCGAFISLPARLKKDFNKIYGESIYNRSTVPAYKLYDQNPVISYKWWQDNPDKHHKIEYATLKGSTVETVFPGTGKIEAFKVL